MTFFFKKPIVTDPKTDIQRLEFKVNLLLGISAAQAILLGLWFLSSLMMPSWGAIILGLLSLGGFIAVFRGQIPGWLGMLFRWFVGRLRRQPHQSTESSIK